MLIPHGTIIAVADGAILNLFRNSGSDIEPTLAALPDVHVSSENTGSGAHHPSSAANPDDNQQAEDSFAAGIAAVLNKRVLDGTIEHLVIIAAPRTLGELRKHYHKALAAILLGEIPKDLTRHTVDDLEKRLVAA